jgi:hypothetical protein
MSPEVRLAISAVASPLIPVAEKASICVVLRAANWVVVKDAVCDASKPLIPVTVRSAICAVLRDAISLVLSPAIPVAEKVAMLDGNGFSASNWVMVSA